MPIRTTVAATYCFRPRLGHSLTYLGHDMDHVWITIVLHCDIPRGTYCAVIFVIHFLLRYSGKLLYEMGHW